MRFEVTMINEIRKNYKEVVIENKEKKTKINVETFNPSSKIYEARFVY